jgi:hypothetical protein
MPRASITERNDNYPAQLMHPATTKHAWGNDPENAFVHCLDYGK